MKRAEFMILAVVLSLTFSNCGEQKEENVGMETVEASTPTTDTTPVTVDKETKLKFNFALSNIPSPVAMMHDVSKWGETYNAELFNDTKKSNTYTSEFAKAINLGVYNTDLAYAMVNDKGADVLKYMRTVLVLSDALGLRGAVDQMVGKRAEKNLANKDSLLAILQEIFTKSDSYLRTNERVYTATAVFAGSWIESLYLTGKIAGMSDKPEIKEKARTHLWEQRLHIDNLIAVLEQYKDKKDAATLANAFKDISTDLNAVKDAKDMDEKKFQAISEKLFSLRNGYTG